MSRRGGPARERCRNSTTAFPTSRYEPLEGLLIPQVRVVVRGAEDLGVVRRGVPIGAQRHQGNHDRGRNQQQKRPLQTARRIGILDTSLTETQRGTPTVRVAEHQDPSVHAFQEGVGGKTETEQHAEHVKILEKIGGVVEDQVVQRAEVFADEETDHRPSQRGEIGVPAPPENQQQHQRKQRVGRFDRESADHRGRLLVPWRPAERECDGFIRCGSPSIEDVAVGPGGAADPLLDPAPDVRHALDPQAGKMPRCPCAAGADVADQQQPLVAKRLGKIAAALQGQDLAKGSAPSPVDMPGLELGGRAYVDQESCIAFLQRIEGELEDQSDEKRFHAEARRPPPGSLAVTEPGRLGRMAGRMDEEPLWGPSSPKLAKPTMGVFEIRRRIGRSSMFHGIDGGKRHAGGLLRRRTLCTQTGTSVPSG